MRQLTDSDSITQQLDALDMLAAGIETPTITGKEAEKWGMLDSEFYKYSCLVRQVAGRNLQSRRYYIAGLEKKHGADSEVVYRFKDALKFEWEKLR